MVKPRHFSFPELLAPPQVIAEHLPVFEKNGFCLKVDGNAPPMQRISVTAVPFSKGTQFGVSDIHELASIIADDPLHSEDARLPKVGGIRFVVFSCIRLTCFTSLPS
jgi:DNA mismatch repair ATPase MutL